MRAPISFLLASASLAVSNPLVSKRWAEADLREKHAWVDVPRGWVYKAAPEPDHVLDMRIGLKKANVEGLISSLFQVSTPSHERYGQHLSKEDVDALVAPHEDTVEAVESWLQFHGIDPSSASASTSSGNMITVSMTVADAERMLGAEYGVYYHPASDSTVVRTLKYALPEELHNHITVMSPTTYFSTVQSMRRTSFISDKVFDERPVGAVSDFTNVAPVPSSCRYAITIKCLRGLYNTVGYVPAATDRNVLGVAGYLDQYANRADLQTFLKRYRPEAAGASYDTISISDGGDDQDDPGVEANLDIQYTVGMSWPTPNVYYTTGGSPPFDPDTQTPINSNEPYLDWLNYVLAQDTVPQTFTTSYGDDEQTVPYDYAVSVCELLAELGARGSTVFYSSGDFGVGGGDCLTNDGTRTVQFQPAFPASCPYVTAVGGTWNIPEVAVDFSGDGFSNYFSRPSYQVSAVSGFLSDLANTYAGLYNSSGRAYPDVAAQGSDFEVVIGGIGTYVGGTSASSPTVAGIFSLLNDYRISHGHPPLGFVNPLLYANPSALNDIVSGNNPGCGTDGFESQVGWDPVTGLGTPDFVRLQGVVL